MIYSSEVYTNRPFACAAHHLYLRKYEWCLVWSDPHLVFRGGGLLPTFFQNVSRSKSRRNGRDGDRDLGISTHPFNLPPGMCLWGCRSMRSRRCRGGGARTAEDV